MHFYPHVFVVLVVLLVTMAFMAFWSRVVQPRLNAERMAAADQLARAQAKVTEKAAKDKAQVEAVEVALRAAALATERFREGVEAGHPFVRAAFHFFPLRLGLRAARTVPGLVFLGAVSDRPDARAQPVPKDGTLAQGGTVVIRVTQRESSLATDMLHAPTPDEMRLQGALRAVVEAHPLPEPFAVEFTGAVWITETVHGHEPRAFAGAGVMCRIDDDRLFLVFAFQPSAPLRNRTVVDEVGPANAALDAEGVGVAPPSA